MAQTPPPTTLSKQHHAAPTTRIIPFPAATGKGTAETDLYTLKFQGNGHPTINEIFPPMTNLRWEAIRRFSVSNTLAGFVVIDSSGNECPLEEIAAAFKMADKEVKNLFFAERRPL